MSEWISVEDRLPESWDCFGGTEFSKSVLVIDDDSEMFVDWVIYPHGVYGADTTPRFNVNYEKQVKIITHWQPLPDPPKE